MSVAPYYRLNKAISGAAGRLMSLAKSRSADVAVDLAREPIEKILLVRPNFRMGDSVLATPAILLFRKNFPAARIDFVGSPMSRALFQNLPIERHYEITRRFPHASWAYFRLIKQIRSIGYDLAVDVSGSQSSMGAFVVGFSGARLRAGLRGKKDRWLNIRLPKPAEKNKYRVLPALVAALGLQAGEAHPYITLTAEEKAEGKRRMDAALEPGGAPVAAVFVGGRASRRKRLPAEYFLRLAAGLRRAGARTAVFVGPEEKDLIEFFKRGVEPGVPVLYEPSVRRFAAMVSRCALFVTSDSGPMHLACAVGARVVAIFQRRNYHHWGPPPALGRIVFRKGGPGPDEVVAACVEELFPGAAAGAGAPARREAKKLA